MPLISTSIPNLAGGVSQQPDSQRLPNQCEEQINGIPLLVGGLIKRPPTNHIFELQNSSASLDLSSAFTHFITRDAQEEFLVTIPGTSNQIFVHGMDGVQRTVYVDSDVTSGTYLNSSSPQTDFRAVTIADVTFLVNRSKTVAQAAGLTTYSRGQSTQQYEGLVWFKASGQGINYKTTITDNSGSTTHSLELRHGPDPDALGATATLPGLKINRSKADISAATVEVTETTLLLKEDGSTAHTILLYGANNDTLVEIVEDINAIANWSASLEGGGSTNASQLEVVGDTNVYNVWAEFKVETTPQSYAYPPNHPSTSDVAKFFADGTTIVDCTATYSSGSSGGLNGFTGYTASSSGSVMWITNHEDFQLTVDDSLGQTAHQVIKDSVESFSDLPPVAKNGMLVKVVGDPESEVDDYYVKFETNGGGDFGEGIWVESMGPGEKYLWDYSTLPLILVRQTTTDGNGNLTFVVKTCDGDSPSTGADSSIDWENFKFTPRETGSLLTNPNPSFIGESINDISFFRNRLAIVAGENCSLSETGELFNFFRTTTTFLPDTAPIDVGVGGTEINRLDKAVPFSDRLILFSEKTQFALQGGTILSPTSASITQVTNYDVTTTVRPVPIGNSLMFAFSRGTFSGIREYFKTNETDINFTGVESTSHAPRYIKGVVQKIVASTEENIAVVLAKDKNSAGVLQPTSTLYVYKFFNTQQGRAQQAWCKLSLGNVEIIDLHFLQQSLYLVLKRGSKTFLERMDIQTGLTDDSVNYVTHLDRRVLVESGDISGNTLALPYNIEDGDTMQVVSAYSSVGGNGEMMSILSAPVGTNQITLSEDIVAGEKFWVGIPYTLQYEMTKPLLKRPRGDGGVETVVSGRHQIRYMTFVFDSTAYFKIRVTPLVGGSPGDSVDYPYTGRYLSAGAPIGSVGDQDGDFRIPVFAQSDSVKIEILNDSPFPSNLQSVEIEANYVSRTQRSQ